MQYSFKFQQFDKYFITRNFLYYTTTEWQFHPICFSCLWEKEMKLHWNQRITPKYHSQSWLPHGLMERDNPEGNQHCSPRSEPKVNYCQSYHKKHISVTYQCQYPNGVEKISTWHFRLQIGVLFSFNTLRPRKDGRHFPDDIFKCIFLNENV